jgi:hypothetical protein
MDLPRMGCFIREYHFFGEMACFAYDSVTVIVFFVLSLERSRDCGSVFCFSAIWSLAKEMMSDESRA